MQHTELGYTWWEELETAIIKNNKKLNRDDSSTNNSNFIQPYCSDFYVIDATFDNDASL